MQEKAGDLVSPSQGFGDSESLTGLENDLDACWKVDPVTRRDKDRLHSIFRSEDNPYIVSILLYQLKTSPGGSRNNEFTQERGLGATDRWEIKP